MEIKNKNSVFRVLSLWETSKVETPRTRGTNTEG